MFPEKKLVLQYLVKKFGNIVLLVWECPASREGSSSAVLELHSLPGSHSGTVLAHKGVGLAQPVLHAQLQDLWYSQLPPLLPPHKLLLYGGFSTGGLLCWDLTNSKQVQRMEVHFSVVTAFSIAYCGFEAVSCGIDAVCVV